MERRPMALDGAGVVIVGGGLAGGNAAATLREEGFAGRLVMVSRELGIPFGRPPLSKTFLRSEEDLDGWYVRPAAWYEDHDVERLSEQGVTTVDAARHVVTLNSGGELEYEKLLVATGGRNRQLRIPGAELPGLHYLRTVAECDALKQVAVAGARAVIVGMGFIGCEVAASLTELGVHVTTVFPRAVPLERVLGAEIGGAIADFHREHGVELRTGDQVVAFEGGGRLQAAVTEGGERIACDFAVAGVGITPDVPTFEAAAVEISNGVLVDELCRASAPDIYAAGDVANQQHPLFGRVRVEHYNNAEKQGRAAARSMLDCGAPYDYIHSFWSDQYEHSIEYVGHTTAWDEFVVRGSVEEPSLLGFYLRDGVLRAAVGVDRGGDPEAEADSEMAACARLVAQQVRPRSEQLADEQLDLWSLVG
jgi:3-phenylpropionate/trans-cinnamate dioxygenase ferredoxin reductase component